MQKIWKYSIVRLILLAFYQIKKNVSDLFIAISFAPLYVTFFAIQKKLVTSTLIRFIKYN